MVRKIFTLLVMLLLVAGMQAGNLMSGHFFKSLKKENVSTENVDKKFGTWFSLPAETEWRIVSRQTDDLGMERIEYRQYVAGIEVEHSQVLIHARDGRVITANGTVMEQKLAPAKLRKAHMAYKNGTPVDFLGREIYLVDTPTGYCYAVKVLSADGLFWIYYDVDSGVELKRITTVRHLSDNDYVPTTATGRSVYSGELTLDVTKGPNGVYLYDQQRNIETRIGSYIPTVDEMMELGIVFDYFPQGNMPDDPKQATKEQLNEWYKMINQLFNASQFPLLEKQVQDFTYFASSPTDRFEAYRITKLKLESVLAPDSTGTLQPFQPSEEHPVIMGIEIYYNGDSTAISKGAIEKYAGLAKHFPIELNLDSLIETLPREGATFVVYRYHITPEEITANNITDLTPYAELLGYISYVPSENDTHVDLQNQNLHISLDYEKYGDPVVDIHWGMARTLDFYKEKFNRNSYDNQGSPVYNLIYLREGANSFLTGSRNNAGALLNHPYPMIYGLGGANGSRFLFNPVVELSVMSHEFTHVITGNTADLVYQGESGALNESFSDLMAVSLKKYVQGNDANWYIGEGIMIGCSNMRDMAHPWLSQDGRDPLPGFYQGQNWVDTESSVDHGGVHTNSGVQNRWYFLLTDGESGTDEKGIAYDITGIGIEKSQQIAYRTLTQYATQQSQYADIRPASLQAAEDLYGENSVEVQTVSAAWNAVGVYENGEDPTGIAEVKNQESKMNDAWYTLGGRLLDGKPTKSGLYIHNGNKVVIK